MKINIVTVGNLKEKYLTAMQDEYLKRLSNYAKVTIIEEKEENGKYTDFSDIAKVSDYARTSVINVHKQELISGYTEGDFRPMNNATRAETAVIIQRILNRINKG